MPELENVTVLAFDYGDMRVGVAMANSLLKIPHPLTTICAEGMWAKIDEIAKLIEKWQPGLLLVGLPHFNDNPQKVQLINTINNFARRLFQKFNIKVELVNEDFTSFHAKGLLHEQGISERDQKGKLDQLAACSILDLYFNHHI